MAKILAIEDELVILENILELLGSEGFEVCGARSGAEGVKLAKQLRPDLIICDVMMPGIDGHKVLELLQEDPDTATIPFIFLSANAALKDIRRGMNSGALDYLTKPFSRIELLQAVFSRIEIADRVKQLMRTREEAVRRRMLSEIPDSFGNLLNAIIGSIQNAQTENETAINVIEELIKELDSSSGNTDIVAVLKKIERLLEVYKEQNSSLADGILVSSKMYAVLLSLFRSIEKI